MVGRAPARSGVSRGRDALLRVRRCTSGNRSNPLYVSPPFLCAYSTLMDVQAGRAVTQPYHVSRARMHSWPCFAFLSLLDVRARSAREHVPCRAQSRVTSLFRANRMVGTRSASSGAARFDGHSPRTVRGGFAFSIFFGRAGPDRAGARPYLSDSRCGSGPSR